MDDAANEAIISNEANEASLADKADDAVESDAANKADSAHKAADATKANDATANKADVADNKPSEAVEAETYKANNAEADEADEAINDIEKVRSLLVVGIAIVLYLVFSLTKYSVIFTEVEGDFEKNNNQLGTVEIARSVKIWSKSCSLRM